MEGQETQDTIHKPQGVAVPSSTESNWASSLMMAATSHNVVDDMSARKDDGVADGGGGEQRPAVLQPGAAATPALQAKDQVTPNIKGSSEQALPTAPESDLHLKEHGARAASCEEKERCDEMPSATKHEDFTLRRDFQDLELSKEDAPAGDLHDLAALDLASSPARSFEVYESEHDAVADVAEADETSVDDVAQLLRFIERLRNEAAENPSSRATDRLRGEGSGHHASAVDTLGGGAAADELLPHVVSEDGAEREEHGAMWLSLRKARRAAYGTDPSDVSAQLSALGRAVCDAVRELCSCSKMEQSSGRCETTGKLDDAKDSLVSETVYPTRADHEREHKREMQEFASIRDASASTVESCRAEMSRLLHELDGARRDVETASEVDPLLLPVAWRGLPTTAAHLEKLMASDIAALHRAVEASLLAAERARTDAVRALVDVSAQLRRDRGMLEEDVAAMRAHARAVLDQIASDERDTALSVWPAARKAADVWSTSAARFRARVKKLASDAGALLGSLSVDRAAAEDVVARLLAVDSAIQRSEHAVSASMSAAATATARSAAPSAVLRGDAAANAGNGADERESRDDFSSALAVAARTLKASIREISAATEAAAREAVAIRGATVVSLGAAGDDALSSPHFDAVAEKAKVALRGADMGIVQRALALAHQRERTCRMRIASLREQRAALARQAPSGEFSLVERAGIGGIDPELQSDDQTREMGASRKDGACCTSEGARATVSTSRARVVGSLRESLSKRLGDLERREREAKLAMQQAELSRSLAQLQRTRAVLEDRSVQLRSRAALQSLREFADAKSEWETAARVVGEAVDLVAVLDARNRAGAYAARDALRVHANETAAAVYRNSMQAASRSAARGSDAACLAIERDTSDAAAVLKEADAELTSTVQTLTGAVSALSAFLSDAAPGARAEAEGALPPGAGVRDLRAAASRYCRARAEISDAVARGALATWAVSVVDILEYALEACAAARDAEAAVQNCCVSLKGL